MKIGKGTRINGLPIWTGASCGDHRINDIDEKGPECRVEGGPGPEQTGYTGTKRERLPRNTAKVEIWEDMFCCVLRRASSQKKRGTQHLVLGISTKLMTSKIVSEFLSC
jgi:hypothetical protein